MRCEPDNLSSGWAAIKLLPADSKVDRQLVFTLLYEDAATLRCDWKSVCWRHVPRATSVFHSVELERSNRYGPWLRVVFWARCGRESPQEVGSISLRCVTRWILGQATNAGWRNGRNRLPILRAARRSAAWLVFSLLVSAGTLDTPTSACGTEPIALSEVRALGSIVRVSRR